MSGENFAKRNKEWDHQPVSFKVFAIRIISTENLDHLDCTVTGGVL